MGLGVFPGLSVSLQFIVKALHGGRVQAEPARMCNSVEQRLPTLPGVRGHHPSEEKTRSQQQLVVGAKVSTEADSDRKRPMGRQAPKLPDEACIHPIRHDLDPAG